VGVALTRSPPSQREAAAVAAWIAVVPTAAIVLPAMLVLGPPLGRLLPSQAAHFWPGIAWLAVLEPTEQARYLIALTAPLVLIALTGRIASRLERGSSAPASALATATEVAAVAALASCLLLQRAADFTPRYAYSPKAFYFSVPTLVAAAAISVLVVALTRWRGVTTRLARWTAESRARAGGAALVAVAATMVTLLPAIFTEASLAGAHEEVIFHLRFTYDETAAVLNGRSPLGDFAAQYSSLWPYALAAAVAPFGGSIGAFTVAMAALTGATMLALYALLRRVTHSALLALALFLPLLATSAFRLHGGSVARFSLVNYFGTMPLRYVGSFVLAWLVARHLDGARPRRAWPLFAVAGLVAINNAEFGVPALGATLAALLWCERLTRSRLRALAIELLRGLALAVALVVVLLLVRTGALPDPSLALRYARLFASSGFAALPIRPQLGVSTIMFLTYVAALGAAAVLAMRSAGDRLLVGLLAWSGVFGLGTGAYFVTRSTVEALVNLFPAWGLALALLTVVVVRELAARGGRRPRAIELACLFAFGLLACSLAQTPSPAAQVRRITADRMSTLVPPAIEQFVAANAAAGEPVVILADVGHRIAYDVGIDDVTPYTGLESVLTQEQLDDTLAALRAAGGTKVFVANEAELPDLPKDLGDALLARGALSAARSPDFSAELWVVR
jgi:hypothetical protein